MQIGVIHNLSKRTAVYGYWGQNDIDNIRVGRTAALAIDAQDLKQTDFTVGLRHSF
jgi:predicted porin